MKTATPILFAACCMANGSAMASMQARDKVLLALQEKNNNTAATSTECGQGQKTQCSGCGWNGCVPCTCIPDPTFTGCGEGTSFQDTKCVADGWPEDLCDEVRSIARDARDHVRIRLDHYALLSAFPLHCPEVSTGWIG